MADGPEHASGTGESSVLPEGRASSGVNSDQPGQPTKMQIIAFCTSCEQYANSNDKYASTPLQLHWPKKSKNKAPRLMMLLRVQFGTVFGGVLSLGFA